ncbi:MULTISPECIES: ATP-dependent Clp protease ATP-binding subunit [unclassified Fibrobacter]|uniref:ATP-dependent Clp protease ATP-binding subunit n=1 Tax=unclassified Fibrobacter TaxID=2634177 RepID=UPI0009211ABD|nr:MULTISPECIES: ATP-dependent Clp protease ATP-binding subunit [Fibrobacter]MCL4101857.1 Negative regulator of genetic competence ClpC/MecB [Fibrobacter succinogenes]OWV06120.1 Clp protease ClpC [Fibrobacter sp. UWH3]OWV15603.1 Clp protease ClpC [Fibrobacter sp. UWH1]SHK99241.1 ATP-dependent Clp protease ATP-binding subunit ClpC [Fibrobacter sp. UWH6]SHL58326.1 ATP-dependent Clp protease ATP-binding subunit ClpC [Fibrobacter sp. UWH5]
MSDINGIFSKKAKAVLQAARMAARNLGSDSISTEHLLLGLVREDSGFAAETLTALKVNLNELGENVQRSLTSNGGIMTVGDAHGALLSFTIRCKAALFNAAKIAKDEGDQYIGPEHLMLAILQQSESPAAGTLSTFGVTFENFQQALQQIKRDAMESQVPGEEGMAGEGPFGGEQPREGQPRVGETRQQARSQSRSKTPILEHFGRDLTAMARQGKLDPIIGREAEIERLIQILCRRKKNNPALIGEPGVGKTAIIEGLALKIAQKKIPELLANKRVVSLDVAAMVAGTKYRGQFEERVKGLIMELQRVDNSVILFIDELHTIVGAGGSEGSLDASNIFKPALARGELQCIGATTIDEYRKYIEKDAALERRFQTIVVNPPSSEDSIQILEGLRAKYAQHHKVRYTPEAIRASVTLAERYISDRFLPDKAIDVLDEAGARVRLNSIRTPQDLKEMEDALAEALQQKEEAIAEQQYETAAALRDKIEALTNQIAERREALNKEDSAELPVVDENEIRDCISKMTGIPVSRLAGEEAQKLLKLGDEIKERVIGQDQAVDAVVKAIRRTRAGIRNNKRPMGSFLFLGPTGVGKTELAKVLSLSLFGSEESMIRIDMSEYMEKHSISRLIGAPPGYVGFEDNGGQLSEKVRKRPYCVVLLDEIEKAHPDVYNLLLQILDDGILTDSYGRKINFKNTIIIMTSNAGAREVRHSSGMGFTKMGETDDYERMETAIREEVKRVFSPEFLNRIDEQIVFRPLTKKDLSSVVDIQLTFLQKNLSERGILLEVSQAAKEFVVSHNYDSALGARPIRRSIQQLIEDEIAEGLLLGIYKDFSTISLDVVDGKLKFTSEALPS